MIRALLMISGLAAAGAGVMLAFGSRRWEAGTRAMHAVLQAARLPVEPKKYDARELRGLPAPVRRYFRAVLSDGAPIITAARMEHTGTFNMSETGEQWKPFTSVQRVTIRRPGFDWDARIRMAPGLTVRVHDAYIAGEGILGASLFGLIPLASMRGTPELARGELMRFFAETAWYPTALLPGHGVLWEAVDDSSARATMRDGELAITLLFRFSGDGLIESVYADERGRTVGEQVIPTPWEGRWSRWERRDGVLVPCEGEVAWILPEGPKPYWRGRLTALSYERA